MKEWFNYSIEDLQLDIEKQKEVYKRMIDNLEKEGKCRGVFHKLAFVLFLEDME